MLLMCLWYISGKTLYFPVKTCLLLFEVKIIINCYNLANFITNAYNYYELYYT